MSEPVQLIDLRERVNFLLDRIEESRGRLQMDFVVLGNTLLEIRDTRKWVGWGFPSWGAYVGSLQHRVERGRSQLYDLVGVAEKLLPSICEADLKQIGVSKAIELKRALKHGELSGEVIEKAKDANTTVKELRAELFKTVQPPDEKDVYWEMRFFLSPEQLKEVQQAFAIAAKLNTNITPEMSEQMRKKLCFMDMVREFIGTWSAEVKE